MLSKLNALATEKDPQRRQELLSAVADLFLQNADAGGEIDSELFHDVVSRLLDDVQIEGRAEFAAKVAPSEHTPQALAETLARDENVEVAGPVLRQSPVLNDEVLVEIAKNQSQSHMREIANRDSVSRAVSDVIVDRGSREVVETLASNSGAAFSEYGFTRLAERSVDDSALASSLFRRTDVPKDIAIRLLEDMPDDVRAKLDELALNNVVSAHKLIYQAAQMAQKGDEPANVVPRYATSTSRHLFAAVRSGDMSVDEALTHLAEADQLTELALLLAKLSGLPSQELRGLMSKTDLTAVAVVCKQLDVGISAFEQIAEMLGRQMSLPHSHTSHFVGQYDELNDEVVARVSRFVSLRRKLS